MLLLLDLRPSVPYSSARKPLHLVELRVMKKRLLVLLASSGPAESPARVASLACGLPVIEHTTGDQETLGAL